MLDTIVLSLDQRQFEVMAPERFSPSAIGLLRPPYYALGARGNFACVQNPTKAEFAAGLYRPRLTLSKRKATAGFAITLRVEFSAPKLIFGNNFDELRSQDFEKVLGALHRALNDMGIRVAEETLRAAPVSAIHYSKNIAFTDFTTCSMVMGQLAKIDLSQRLDLSHTDYRNEGHAIRYHANSFEVTFYDKMKDIQKARFSEKRAIEKDYGTQISLFATPEMFPKQLEVLRMEVRLGTRTKIRALMVKVGAEVEPTFAALFDLSLAKAVLLHFWENVRVQLPLIDLDKGRRPEDILGDLAVHAQGTARPGKLLQQVGAATLVGSVGFRGFSALMGRHCSARSWQRYKRDLKSFPAAPQAIGHPALKQIDTALAAFRPLRMSNFHTPSDQGSVSAGDFPKSKRTKPARVSAISAAARVRTQKSK